MDPLQPPAIPPVAADGTNAAMPAAQTPEEEARKYRKRLEASGKVLSKSFHRRAKRMVQYYELHHYIDQEGNELEATADRVQVNTPYANLRQIVAEIRIKDLQAIVKPTKNQFDPPQQAPAADPMGGMAPALPQAPPVDGIKGAQKLKSCVEHALRESNFKRSDKLALLEGGATGLGCVMITTVQGSKIPKYERITFKDLVWSHEVLDIYESPWIARKVVKLLDEVKADPRFNDNKNKVQPAKSDPKSSGGSDDSWCVLWDLWDKKNDRHLLIPDGQDCDLYDNKTISEDYDFKQEGDEFAADWPFVFYVNEEQLTQAFGLGDIAPIEPQVQEKNRLRTDQVNHVKRFNRKYFVKSGFVDESEMWKLTEGPDGTVVTVKRDITPGEFQAVQDAPLSSDTYRVEGNIDRDTDIVQAFGPNGVARGVGQQAGTLGEAQIVDQNANTRVDDKRDAVSHYYGRVLRLTARFVQQHWIESDVMLVTGDGTSETDWLHYNPAEIQGEYRYEVDPESATDNSAVYRKQANEALATLVPLLQLVAPSVPGGPPGPSPVEGSPAIATMARRYLETFDIFKRDLDSIIPEALTEPKPPMPPPGMPPMGGPPQGGGDPGQQLMDLVNKHGPQALLDNAGKLPQNERDAILAHLKKGGQGIAPQTPSESNLSAAASRI